MEETRIETSVNLISSCSPYIENPLMKRYFEVQRLRRRAQEYSSCAFKSMSIFFLTCFFNSFFPCMNRFWMLITSITNGSMLILCAYCVYKYISYLRTPPIVGTREQMKLLGFQENDPLFVIGTAPAPIISKILMAKLEAPKMLYSSIRDAIALGYEAGKSLTWSQVCAAGRAMVVDQDMKLIRTEKGLRKYLDAVEAKENEKRQSSNRMAKWIHEKFDKLRKTVYQLSPMGSTEEVVPDTNLSFLLGPPMPLIQFTVGDSYLIKKVPREKLQSYVNKLRIWLSTTILQALTREIAKIDQVLLSINEDLQIGKISLQRLKKLAENNLISRNLPTLPNLIPYLDFCNDQQYLVQRIKDLSGDGSLATFQWNKGASYFGFEWAEHLPTDAALVFNLFCVFLDTMIKPTTYYPHRKFYDRYVIEEDTENEYVVKRAIAKAKSLTGCAIYVTNPLKSKFNFIANGEMHKNTYCRYNLFYTIIEFLIYMKTSRNGCLEGYNLGKCGINILGVIEDQYN